MGEKREAERRDGCKPVVTVSICSSVNSWIRLPWRPVVGIKIRLMHLATRKKRSEAVEELKGFDFSW